MLAAFYMKFPPERFTESYLTLGENIKSIEEFEKRMATNNSGLQDKKPKQEIKMFFDRDGLPVKRITYGIGGRDTTFITYNLDSLNSLTSKSRTYRFNNGKSFLGSYDGRFRIQNDSAAMYYQNGMKLADYGFYRTTLKYMNAFGQENRTVFIYNQDGDLIKEIHNAASEKGTTENEANTVSYKYLEFDSAGNWTKRFRLNTNGFLFLESREYNYY